MAKTPARGDLALIGSGVATAAAALTFAAYMTMGGVRKPLVFGMDHLAIFAQPSHAHKFGPVDMSPVGAIAHDKDHVSGYALVGAEGRFAWLREGDHIFAVRPGDEVPRLGKIAAIEQRDGRWTLLDGQGGALIVSARAELAPSTTGRFGKKMIFGD